MNPLNQVSRSPIIIQRPPGVDSSRPLSSVIADLAPVVPWGLFIGLAEDGLPVLFNLRGTSAGPILVSADAGAGKTRLLQTVARGIELAHDAARIRYTVITAFPQEWSSFDHSPHCDGILTFHHALTTGYLHCAALGHPADVRSPADLVLLIDGFEALAADGDLRHAVHALLQSPPPSGVLPIVTLNTSTYSVPDAWLETFSIRLFGYVQDPRMAEVLSHTTAPFAGSLQPPAQFAAREGDAWLQFWLPELD